MKEWIQKYEEQFEEQFPLFFLPNDVDSKIVIAIIMHCLENDEPYDPNDPSIIF